MTVIITCPECQRDNRIPNDQVTLGKFGDSYSVIYRCRHCSAHVVRSDYDRQTICLLSTVSGVNHLAVNNP